MKKFIFFIVTLFFVADVFGQSTNVKLLVQKSFFHPYYHVNDLCSKLKNEEVDVVNISVGDDESQKTLKDLKRHYNRCEECNAPKILKNGNTYTLD